jgi:putative membrane protein
MVTSATRSPERPWLLAIVVALLAWSGVHPAERFTWVLEVTPVLIGIPILVVTAARFPLTPLAYRLLALHAVILMVGGHYTYAKAPLGFWMEDVFGFTRNHYDRIGHFAQGFVPAIVAREILLRRSPLRQGRWLFFLVTCICLALSAAYELLEWGAAMAFGGAADSFLGTQGDVCHTQWDMLLAIVGAVVAQLTLAGIHDRQLAALPRGPSER